MTRLPRSLSGRRLTKALGKAGFRVVRQTGSHLILRRDDPYAQVTVPLHGAVAPGTLRQVMRVAELNVEGLRRLL